MQLPGTATIDDLKRAAVVPRLFFTLEVQANGALGRACHRRRELFSLTNVNPSKQKLLGMKHKGAAALGQLLAQCRPTQLDASPPISRLPTPATAPPALAAAALPLRSESFPPRPSAGKPTVEDGAPLSEVVLPKGPVMMIGTPDAEIDEVVAASDNAPDILDDFDVGVTKPVRASGAAPGSPRIPLPPADAALCLPCRARPQLALADRPENVQKLARRVGAVTLTVRNPPRAGKKLLVLVRPAAHLPPIWRTAPFTSASRGRALAAALSGHPLFDSPAPPPPLFKRTLTTRCSTTAPPRSARRSSCGPSSTTSSCANPTPPPLSPLPLHTRSSCPRTPENRKPRMSTTTSSSGAPQACSGWS